MSLNLNRVMLAGHFTRDPQIRILASDNTVANFGLAINHRYKGKDGETKEDTTFVDCEAWGKTAELIGKWLTKGSPIYIEGRLRFESWQDKDGGKHSKLKVVVDSMQFLGSKPAGGAAAPAPAPAATPPTSSAHRAAGPIDDQPPF